MNIDEKLAELNAKVDLLTKTDFSFREKLAKTLSSSDDLEGYKTFSMRLPIRDYATIKLLADDLKMSPSSLGRSIFLVTLSEAVSIHLEKNPDSDWGERHQELCTDLYVDQQG